MQESSFQGKEGYRLSGYLPDWEKCPGSTVLACAPSANPPDPSLREQRRGIPSFPIPGPDNLEPGAFSCLALPSNRGSDRGDSRGWWVGSSTGDLIPRSLVQLVCVFSPGKSVPQLRLARPHPHPRLRGRGPTVPTGDRQCQASQPGSGPRSGAQALGKSHLGFQKRGLGCSVTPTSRLST